MWHTSGVRGGTVLFQSGTTRQFDEWPEEVKKTYMTMTRKGPKRYLMRLSIRAAPDGIRFKTGLYAKMERYDVRLCRTSRGILA